MSRLVQLYPLAWRERYEAEFLELLRERHLGPRDRLDVVHGAIDAHLQPQQPDARHQPWTHRIPGLFALSAGLIWVTWFLNAYWSGPEGEWGDGLGYAILLMLISVPGDYLARHGRRILAGIGATGAAAILAWTLPWSIADGLLNLAAGIAGYLVAGAGLLSVAAIRAGIGPGIRWTLTVAGVLVPAAIAIPILGGFGPTSPDSAWSMLVAALPYGIVWTLIGLRLTLRGSATITDTPSNPRVTEAAAA